MDLLTRKEEISTNISVISGGEKEFPWLEVNEENNKGNIIQKLVVLSLRDALRWKNYRFFPGRDIDILWTKDEFVVFRIVKTAETIEFKPIGVYKNTDIGMLNSLDVDLKKIDCKDLVWKKEDYKASDVNRTIRKLERNSFDRKSFIEVEG